MTGAVVPPYPDGSKTGLLENAVSDKSLFDTFLTLPDGVEKATVRAYFADKPDYAARLAAIERSDSSEKKLSEETVSALYGDCLLYTSRCV